MTTLNQILFQNTNYYWLWGSIIFGVASILLYLAFRGKRREAFQQSLLLGAIAGPLLVLALQYFPIDVFVDVPIIGPYITTLLLGIGLAVWGWVTASLIFIIVQLFRGELFRAPVKFW